MPRRLLLRSSKDQGLWVVEGGDLAMRLPPNSLLFLMRTSSLRMKKGRVIYSPSRDLAIAASGDQIIWPKVGRIIRQARLSGPETKSPANNPSRLLGDAELGP
jgi:hypothetical protein